jgi:hypothetical protein
MKVDTSKLNMTDPPLMALEGMNILTGITEGPNGEARILIWKAGAIDEAPLIEISFPEPLDHMLWFRVNFASAARQLSAAIARDEKERIDLYKAFVADLMVTERPPIILPPGTLKRRKKRH